jgi:DNA-binding MarR family transcriptional regulator
VSGRLDEAIHQPVRLRIMAALVAVHQDTRIGFVALRDLLQTTDGNLGAHLRKLEEAGYVALAKTFAGRKPQTFVAVTPAGRRAFAAHTAALRSILAGGPVASPPPPAGHLSNREGPAPPTEAGEGCVSSAGPPPSVDR